jgi:hypothetical protein
MNTRDLFEDRATRGTPRGAAAVWRNAHDGAPVVDGPRRPSWGFRLALAAWVVALVVGALAVRQSDDPPPASTDQPPEESTDESTDDEAAPTSSEPLPAPLLIDGGTISRTRGGVSVPSDPAFDADDLFRSIGADVVAEAIFSSDPDPSFHTLVFARPDDPFTGPIVGIELLPGDGFRPWGANLSSTELAEFVQQLRLVDGRWTLPPNSGLVEVAEVVERFDDLLRFGWQFDIELPGNGRVTLQAEASTPERPADVWRWISRQAYGTTSTELTVTPTEVLGHRGVVIDAGGRSTNEVLWSDGEFVYRLTSSTIEGDTAVSRDATEDVSRLRVVDRAEWVDAIVASTRESIVERLVRLAFLPTMLAAIASAVWFLIRRSYGTAGIAAAVMALLWWTGGLGVAGLALAWLGLAIAWWRHRSPRAANISADARTDP